MTKDHDRLSDMRSHFSDTGRYRPEDVRQVLGDPRITVSVPLRTPEMASGAQTLPIDMIAHPGTSASPAKV